MIRFLLFCCLLAAGTLHAQISPRDPSLQDPNGNPRIFSNTVGTRVNLYEVRAAAEDFWKGRDPFKKGSGYKPYKRWEYYWSHLVDSRGDLPSASQLWQSWQSKTNLVGKDPNPVADWRTIGPTDVGIFSGRLPGTGRLNAIAVDPNNENIWYAGAPAGR